MCVMDCVHPVRGAVFWSGFYLGAMGPSLMRIALRGRLVCMPCVFLFFRHISVSIRGRLVFWPAFLGGDMSRGHGRRV